MTVPTVLYLHGVGGPRPDWDAPLREHVARAIPDLAPAVRFVAPAFADLLSPAGSGATAIRAGGTPSWEETTDPLSAGGIRQERCAPPPHAAGEGDWRAYERRQQGLRLLLRATGEPVPAEVRWPAAVPRPADVLGRLPLGRLLRVPVLGIDQAGRYVHDETARDAVLARVRAALDPAPAPLVVVAHSLGSLVAADLLADLPAGVDVALLVTVGSPLGHEEVAATSRLSAAPFPYDRLGGWVNVVHLLDPVPLGRGVASRFPQAVDVVLPPTAGMTWSDAVRAHVDATYARSRTVQVAVAYGLAAPTLPEPPSRQEEPE